MPRRARSLRRTAPARTTGSPERSGQSSPLTALQQTAGNQVTAALVEFQARTNARTDKSAVAGEDDQDQNASLTSLKGESKGVGIRVEAQGVYSSEQYPDGFRWTQTISTNAPLGGSSSPYVDPRPNDDSLPFYWTVAEAAARPTTFIDHPSRNPPASGKTWWRATLALNGVDKSRKCVRAHDGFNYGFNTDSAGKVEVVYPTSVGLNSHQSTLRASFPAWNFDQA